MHFLYIYVSLTLLTLTTADVAHLSRQYLPAARTTTYSAEQGYSTGAKLIQQQRFVQQQQQRQAYSAPAAQQSYSYSSSSKYIAPASVSIRSYAAPARLTTSDYKQQQQQSAANYNTYSYKAAYTAPATLARNYLPPKAEVETFAPIMQQRVYAPPALKYTAPLVSYVPPAASYSSAYNAGIETKYAANGGYIY